MLLVLLLGPALAAAFSLLVTGDVNLNPALATSDPKFVWGTMLPVLHGADFVAINHESTLAGVKLADPNVIQFEDPLNYLATYGAAGVDFMSQANNHEFDFGLAGVAKTRSVLDGLNIAWGGLGSTPADVRAPRVVATEHGELAFFTLVVDECWKLPNGTLYLDACTCGGNAGPPPAYQCYGAGVYAQGGLWYQWLITDEFIASTTQLIGDYQRAHPDQFVVVFLHVGPNFQWQVRGNVFFCCVVLAAVCNSDTRSTALCRARASAAQSEHSVAARVGHELAPHSAIRSARHDAHHLWTGGLFV